MAGINVYQSKHTSYVWGQTDAGSYGPRARYIGFRMGFSSAQGGKFSTRRVLITLEQLQRGGWWRKVGGGAYRTMTRFNTVSCSWSLRYRQEGTYRVRVYMLNGTGRYEVTNSFRVYRHLIA